MLVGSWTLKKQLLQYVWKPLSREAWNLDISLSSLCTEPWGDSWLKIVSLFAVVLWQCEHKPYFQPEPDDKGLLLGNHKSQSARHMFKLIPGRH